MIHETNNKKQSREFTNVTSFEKAYSSSVKEGMLILGEDVSKIVQDYIE